MARLPVYALAGLQEDPLVEEVLAILFTNEPVREDLQPGDSSRHWQWEARDPRGQSSRLWLNYGESITDTTTAEIEDRGTKALAVLIPTHATKVTVTATQLSFDEVGLDIVLARTIQEDLTIGLIIGAS